MQALKSGTSVPLLPPVTLGRPSPQPKKALVVLQSAGDGEGGCAGWAVPVKSRFLSPYRVISRSWAVPSTGAPVGLGISVLWGLVQREDQAEALPSPGCFQTGAAGLCCHVWTMGSAGRPPSRTSPPEGTGGGPVTSGL